MPIATPTLLLSRADVRALLTLDECIEAVEFTLAAAARGEAPPPRSLGFPTVDGGFHVKAASFAGKRPYFAAKLNGNFPLNGSRHALPTIQGLVLLSDAHTGAPLAVLDSIEITILRTGAATAVAARRLAGADASRVTILGCGNQGWISLDALSRVRVLKSATVWDIDPRASEEFARRAETAFEFPVEPVGGIGARRSATRSSDIVITCTPSKAPILHENDVVPGTFVAAVGADSETKHEIDPRLMASSKVVTDDTDQCARIGDLHHAIETGAMRADQVHASLGEVLCGLRPGRESAREVIVFDSTGTALQDVAAAALVFERALQSGRGTPHVFA